MAEVYWRGSRISDTIEKNPSCSKLANILRGERRPIAPGVGYSSQGELDVPGVPENANSRFEAAAIP